MDIYTALLKEVELLILQTPIDIYIKEYNTSAVNDRYELVKNREVTIGDYKFNSKKIGLANLTWAQQHILNVYIEHFNPSEKEEEKTIQACDFIFKSIIEDLEQKRVVRTFPEVKRQESIKLVVNND